MSLDTADLKDAKALLEELSGSLRSCSTETPGLSSLSDSPQVPYTESRKPEDRDTIVGGELCTSQSRDASY